MAAQPFLSNIHWYLVCIFPFSSGRWMRRRVLHDTAVIVLFLPAGQWAGCWSWAKEEGWERPLCPWTILSHTLQSCQSSKGKKMCSLNSCPGPLFFLFLAILKAVSVLLSLKPRAFVLMISSFNSSILVSPSNLYSWYQLLKEQVR